MNPNAPRPPSRFIRGRARGGGAYRPYFYFRRNGRTIPAGGARKETNDPPDDTARRGGTAMKWGTGRKIPEQPVVSASFVGPENYAVPEDALQVQSFAINNPTECPGWRMYFLRDDYVETSDLVKRVKALEAYYQSNALKYNFMKINANGWFPLEANSITQDESIKAIWPNFAEDLRMRPMRTLSTLAVAMHSVVSIVAIDSTISQPPCTVELYVPRKAQLSKIYVRPIGFIADSTVSLINISHVDQLYAVRGIVTSVSDLDYEFAWIAYQCTRCQQEQAMRQKDDYQYRPFSCKNPKCNAKQGFRELRSSPYTRLRSKQLIRLEESNLQRLNDFETSVPGILDIELRHDLVDSVVVGDEILVTGVIKMRELNAASTSSAAAARKPNSTQIFMKALSIQSTTEVKRDFSERDLDAIGMINAEPDSFKLLVQSLTPEVHGHEVAKAACLLSLFGGAGSQICDESALNVLLVGDPGAGKSKILQMCAKISERGSLISGKRGMFSGLKVGPTFDGRAKRNMQAGALLSANTSNCAIDDIDKLAAQQSLILQTMQSQEINLPYAAAFATLTARPSIIACANSQRGQYNKSLYLLQNVRIMPSLLKEFHLAFVLLDRPSMNKDASLTEHVRALHAGTKKSKHIAARYAMKPKTNESMATSFNMNDDDDANTDDAVKHESQEEAYDISKRLAMHKSEADQMDLLPPVLMKKFVAYARQSVKPLLNEEAAESIKKFYKSLRERSSTEDGRSNIGTGQLIGLIHMAQARARIDLSNEVTQNHVRDVIAIVTESMAQTSLGGTNDDAELAAVAAAGTNIRGTSKSACLRRFLQMLQLRSNGVGRRLFDMDELKEIGERAGIESDLNSIIDIANMQGYLLKKTPTLYQVVPQ